MSSPAATRAKSALAASSAARMGVRRIAEGGLAAQERGDRASLVADGGHGSPGPDNPGDGEIAVEAPSDGRAEGPAPQGLSARSPAMPDNDGGDVEEEPPTTAGRVAARHRRLREEAARIRVAQQAAWLAAERKRAAAHKWASFGAALQTIAMIDAQVGFGEEAEADGDEGSEAGRATAVHRGGSESSAQALAEAERLGALLAKFNVHQLLSAVTRAGFESVDDLTILSQAEVIQLIEDGLGRPLGALRLRKLEQMIAHVASARRQIDSAPERRSTADAPMVDESASAGSKAAASAAPAPKRGKSKKGKAAAAASRASAPDPMPARSEAPASAPSARVQRVLGGFDAIDDSDDDGLLAEEEDVAPPVFASHPADGVTAEPSIIDELPNLTSICDRFQGEERTEEATVNFIRGALRMLNHATDAGIDLLAVSLEMHVTSLVEHGHAAGLEGATSMRVAWLRLAQADAKAKEAAKALATGIPSSKELRRDGAESQQISLLSVAQVSAAAAANAAAAAVGGGLNDADESADERKLRASEAEDRVWKVAQQPGLVDDLESMAKQGREARSESEHRELLKRQKRAQKDSLALAELLHTKDLPATTGACLELLSCLPERERERREHEVKRVLKAATQLVGYIITALQVVETSKTLGKKGGTRMIKSIWYGSFGAATGPSGGYKITEMKSDASASALAKESEVSARSIIRSSATAIKAVVEWGHPRDETARGTIDLILAKCEGESGDEAHHGEVCDAFFSELAELWGAFQSGSYDMPQCEQAWDAVKDKPAVQEVLNGTKAMRRMMEEQRRELDEIKRQKPAGRDDTTRRGTGLPPPKPDDKQPENKVKGMARKALSLKRFNAKKAIQAATEAVNAAKAAGDAGKLKECVAALEAAKKEAANCEAEWNAKA